MSRAPPTGDCWTEARLLARRETLDERYELVDGRPMRTMAGARREHDRIVRNVTTTLHGRPRGRGCETFTADFAVRTRIDPIRRPAVGVGCAPAGDVDA